MKLLFMVIAILITVNTSYSLPSKSSLSFGETIEKGADFITGLLKGGGKTIQTLDNTGEQITTAAKGNVQQLRRLRQNTQERIQTFDNIAAQTIADVGNNAQQLRKNQQNMNVNNILKNIQNTNKVPTTKSINLNNFKQSSQLSDPNRRIQQNKVISNTSKSPSRSNDIMQTSTKEVQISKNQPRKIVVKSR